MTQVYTPTTPATRWSRRRTAWAPAGTPQAELAATVKHEIALFEDHPQP